MYNESNIDEQWKNYLQDVREELGPEVEKELTDLIVTIRSQVPNLPYPQSGIIDDNLQLVWRYENNVLLIDIQHGTETEWTYLYGKSYGDSGMGDDIKSIIRSITPFLKEMYS